MLQRIIKELQVMEIIFARITTAVAFVTVIYVTIFWGPDCEVEIGLIWQIMAIGAISALGDLIVYTRRECSKWRMLFKRVLYFLFVNAAVMGFAYWFGWIYPSNWKMFVAMEISIILVFAIENIICYLADYKTAEEMNQRLKEREKEE